jgi:hypothetical protein
VKTYPQLFSRVRARADALPEWEADQNPANVFSLTSLTSPTEMILGRPSLASASWQILCVAQVAHMMALRHSCDMFYLYPLISISYI